VRNFRDTVKAHNVEYDKTNELMVWSITNAEVVENAKRELLVDKKMRRERIDPVDAILNAWKGAMTESDMQARTAVQKENLQSWLEYMRRI
jgi:phage terminase large subunit-like protein